MKRHDNACNGGIKEADNYMVTSAASFIQKLNFGSGRVGAARPGDGLRCGREADSRHQTDFSSKSPPSSQQSYTFVIEPPL